MFNKKGSNQHLKSGQQAEQLAHNYLITQGMSLLTRNYTCRLGEIDLIMLDQDTLVFVEVRYRASTNYGLAEETITIDKQKKIIRSAQYFLIREKKYIHYACRFDIVAIQGTISEQNINWINNAFVVNT